jgi:hypothetical protein
MVCCMGATLVTAGLTYMEEVDVSVGDSCRDTCIACAGECLCLNRKDEVAEADGCIAFGRVGAHRVV